MSRCIRSRDMTCHQNSLSAHYAQYMFKVDAQAAFLGMLEIFLIEVNFMHIRT